MTARMVIVICEWVLFSIFGLIFLMLILDLPWAWNAQNCSVQPITQGCYPWGGEGPVAGAGWSYASKRNYLASGIYDFGVASIALGSTFLLKPGRRIVALLAAVALFHAGSYFLPLVV